MSPNPRPVVAAASRRPQLACQRSTPRRLLILLSPLALIFAVTGCVSRRDGPPVGAYRSTEGFDPRVNELAAESARSVPQRVAIQIRAGELSPTVPSIRTFIAATDPTPPGYQGEYPRIISATELSPTTFRIELIVYRVAALTDGLSFGNGPAIARWGRACSTSTIDVTNGAKSAQATSTAVDCPPGAPERPLLKNTR